MNRESWFTDSYNRCLENFLQAFVPQIISRLKDQPQIAKVCLLLLFSVILRKIQITPSLKPETENPSVKIAAPPPPPQLSTI